MTTDDRTEDGRTEESRTEEVWERFSGSLASFFRRAAGADDAEDLLQECFLRIHATDAEIPEGEGVGAWVRRVARNLLADHRRRQRASVAGDEPILEPADDDEDLAVARWLPSFVDAVDAPYRDVLRLTELEGRTQAAAADALGLTLGAVKSRVRRGRAQVRSRLLACCELAFDRRGKIVEHRRRRSDGECCED